MSLHMIPVQIDEEVVGVLNLDECIIKKFEEGLLDFSTTLIQVGNTKSLLNFQIIVSIAKPPEVITKAKVQKAIEKSLSYHENQRDVNRDLNNMVAHHHEIIIDFIENELKERLGL